MIRSIKSTCDTLPNATEDEKTKISNLKTRYETKQRILDCIRRAPTPLQDQDKSDLSIAAKNGAAYGLSVEDIETAKTLLLNNFSALAKRLLDSKSLKGFREEEVETLSNLSDNNFLSVSNAQNDLVEMGHLRELAKQKVKVSNILKECKTTAPISDESFKLLDKVRKSPDLTLLDIDSDEIDRVHDEYKFTQAISAYEKEKEKFEGRVQIGKIDEALKDQFKNVSDAYLNVRSYTERLPVSHKVGFAGDNFADEYSPQLINQFKTGLDKFIPSDSDELEKIASIIDFLLHHITKQDLSNKARVLRDSFGKIKAYYANKDTLLRELHECLSKPPINGITIDSVSDKIIRNTEKLPHGYPDNAEPKVTSTEDIINFTCTNIFNEVKEKNHL